MGDFGACAVTGLAVPELLMASHAKPWEIASNAERLDGDNGLPLIPNLDKLIDKGFISFADDGTVMISTSVRNRSHRDCIFFSARFLCSPKPFLKVTSALGTRYFAMSVSSLSVQGATPSMKRPHIIQCPAVWDRHWGSCNISWSGMVFPV